MTPRPTRRSSALKHARTTGALAGATAVGATALLLIATGPAQATQTPAASTSTHAMATSSTADAAGAKGAAQQKLPDVADVLKLALAQVGSTEDTAGGTKYSRWFMSSPYAVRGVQRDGGTIGGYATADWCDMFISWIGNRLGIKGFGGDAYVPAHAKWFQAQGRWGKTAKPGAIAFFSWDDGSLDHLGLVIKDNHDGTIQTVEGNTGDAVRIRNRPTSNTVGYGYPQYAQ